MKRYLFLGILLGAILTFSSVVSATDDLQSRNAYLDQVLSSLINKVGQLTAENTSLRAQLNMNTAQSVNPIVISNVQIETINDNLSSTYTQDKITWTTSTPTTDKIYYTVFDNLRSLDANTELSTDHTAYIRGVYHGTVYSYKIESTNGSETVTKEGTATVR